jgi:hypothetical protein
MEGKSPAGHPHYSLPYKLSVSSINSGYSTFDFEGLISGTKDVLTQQSADDYLLIELEEKRLIYGIYLKAPFSGGVDYNRLNKSILQVLNEETNEWTTIQDIGVTDANMFFIPLDREMKTFRILHGPNIGNSYCLGIGQLRVINKD